MGYLPSTPSAHRMVVLAPQGNLGVHSRHAEQQSPTEGINAFSGLPVKRDGQPGDCEAGHRLTRQRRYDRTHATRLRTYLLAARPTPKD